MKSFEKAFKIKHVKHVRLLAFTRKAMEELRHGTIKNLIGTCIDERRDEWNE